MSAAHATVSPEKSGDRTRGALLFVVTEGWYFRSHRLSLALRAARAGYDVHVATRVEPGETFPDELTVHPLVWRRRGDVLGDIRAFLAIVRLMRRLRPSIVHAVALKAIVFAAAASRFAPPSALVAAVAGLGFSFTVESARARVMRRAVAGALRLLADRPRNVFLFQNEDDARVLRNAGAVHRARQCVIRGAGVDTARFVPLPEPAGVPTIGVVARMLVIKGVGDVVAASAALTERGVPHRLLLAGGPDPDNPASFDEATLRRWSANATVRWLGPVSDVRSVWAQCHVAVLASHGGEGLPKSLLEAAACGRAIVATDVPGIREVAVDGENALRVPPGDLAALADALERMLCDPDLRARFARAGRALVETAFASDVVEERTLALYAAISPAAQRGERP